MRRYLGAGAIAFTLVAGIGFASAQTSSGTTQPQLSDQQRQSIRQGLANQPNDNAPSGYQGQVGTKVPDSMKGHPMPNSVATDVPAVKSLLFVKLPDRVLLIDPDTEIVAELVPARDTTGGTSTPKQ
jgi:hypothetical protein